nr:uncharacterized protein LOC109158743 [Ipomoea batatas]
MLCGLSKMLSSLPENQSSAVVSAEEADLIRRSKKKTKRNTSDRENDPMEMEKEGNANSTPVQRSNNEETTGQIRRRRQANDQHGKPENKERKIRSSGGRSENRYENVKGKTGGNYASGTRRFNQEGFTIWNNLRFGALENLEEETEEEAQDEITMMERPDGPTGTTLSGKGKRPQVQITEAQVRNEKSVTNKEKDLRRLTAQKATEGNRSMEKNRRQTHQAAETENHTVVRGYDKGTRVERTMVTEEGRTTETIQDQTETGDHHQDPPDDDDMISETGDAGDPMSDVVYTEGQSETERGGNPQ